MNREDITVAGVTRKVRSTQLNGRTVIITGKWLKTAAVKDEDYQLGQVATDSEELLGTLRRHEDWTADVFTFAQKPDDPLPKFPFLHEWESVAAIPVVSMAAWWSTVSSDLRRDVRKAAKLGVVVRPVAFTDDFVRGIQCIYDETPVRQGRPFWHYRKGFDAVKEANGTYLERSEFVGAFVGDELIGYLKIVYVDRLARLMQIMSKVAHQDKRPTNALVAKAVELCEAKGCTHLTYGKYRYTRDIDSSLTAFKHRNGFQEILVPRYYVPLTLKGRLALRLGLQHGAQVWVPAPVRRTLVPSLIRAKASFYRRRLVTDTATVNR
jgi:hypothetical protein